MGLEEREANQPLDDVFDVLNMLTKVHGNLPEMSRDFTLANFGNSEVIDQKLPKFIREQMAVVRIIDDYMNLSLESLRRHFPNKTDEQRREMQTEIQAITEKTKNTLLQEVKMLVIMSRNPHGEIVKGALAMGRNAQEELEIPDKSMATKLKEERK